MTLKQKQNFAKARKNIENDSRRKRMRFSIKMANKILFCLIATIGVGYVVSINDLAIKGFVLQELKTESQELRVENNEIELAIMVLESYDSIEKRAQDLSMVKVGKIDYITVTGGSVARK